MAGPITNLPESLQTLAALVGEPGPLRDALVKRHASLDAPGLIALARDHGIDVSAEDVDAAMRSPTPTELSDEALGAVTGGIRGTFTFADLLSLICFGCTGIAG